MEKEYPIVVNRQLKKWVDASSGNDMPGLIQMIASKVLIKNDIVVPPTFYLDWQTLNAAPLTITWPRIYGYFTGNVEGWSNEIDNPEHKYLKPGPQSLDWHGAAF